jgi:thymidylate synthase ThyX
MGLTDLRHTSVSLPNNGKIIVLDTGAVIIPEAEAMIQALHSRSTGGLESHLKILAEKGSENFMKNFYVGYGHKSIGDCGTTTVFVEGVSMLAAKAIQDNPLYSGQESSTRYVDFSQQPFIDPTGTIAGKELLETQRKMYLFAQEPTRQALIKLHSRKEGEDEQLYKKAINARAFDITRGLLPAGASTNLAWHTNLRQAADRILFLRHHPLKEVRKIAEGLEEALKRHHPNSFGHKIYKETEAYQDLIAQSCLFHDSNSPKYPLVDVRHIDMIELNKFRGLLDKRPPKTELPKYLAQAGVVNVRYQLDFGSFRDIQRHRALNQRMPLLTTELGFNEWYLKNIPPEISNNLSDHFNKINKKIEELRLSQEVAQYFIPMGYNTSNRFSADLPSLVYMVELRNTRFVHPTLQRVAHGIGQRISEDLKIPLHLDSEPSRFDIKRGGHDITLK